MCAKHDARPRPRALAVLGGIAILPDPVLLPLSDGGIVGVQTLPTSAARARPVLEQRTSAAHRLHDAVADVRATLRRHPPLADPEVEPMPLGDICTGRW